MTGGERGDEGQPLSRGRQPEIDQAGKSLCRNCAGLIAIKSVQDQGRLGDFDCGRRVQCSRWSFTARRDGGERGGCAPWWCRCKGCFGGSDWCRLYVVEIRCNSVVKDGID